MDDTAARALDDGAFGRVVRDLRLRAGLSLHEVARRAGVDPAYVFRIEAAPSARPAPLPRRPVVLALARALDLDPLQADDLLARAGFVPEALRLLGGWDVTLAQVAAVLLDGRLTAADRAEFREVLALLARRWGATHGGPPSPPSVQP